MTEQEIRDAVARGQGRAILFLRAVGGDGYRDLILELCCRNQAYDPQFENRSAYMSRLVDTLSSPQDLVPALGAQLFSSRDPKSRRQIRRLLAHFREQGSTAARELLVQDNGRFRLQDRPFAQSVHLLGREGLDLAVKHAHRLTKWELREEFDEAVERFGREAALEAFCALPEPQRSYATSCLRHRPDVERPIINAEEVLAEIRQGIIRRAVQFRWAANDEQFEQLAQLGLETPDVAVLRGVARAAPKRSWPLDIETDFARATFERDAELRRLRLLLFEQTTHPSIREWSMGQLRRKGGIRQLEQAFGLLRLNAEPEDRPFILAALRRLRRSKDGFHGAGLDVLHLACGTTAELLKEVYEYGPCDECRSYAVTELKILGALTSEQIDECLEDSNDYIQEIAHGLRDGASGASS